MTVVQNFLETLFSEQIIKRREEIMVSASYQLPDLGYDFNALEPVISAEIMQLHYGKHHQGYVSNLNLAIEKYKEAEGKQDIAAMIALQQAIRFNGGGHVNHCLFWKNLTPVAKGGGEVSKGGKLISAIANQFGTFDAFVEKMSTLTVGIQGSGWGWLGYSQEEGRLRIATSANQDPLSTQGLIPLLGIDVWEHAYYLQYKNIRAEYVKNIWKLMNWQEIDERYRKVCLEK